MNAWKVILATVVLFGAGVVTGGLLVRQSLRARLGRAPRPVLLSHPGPASPGGMRYEFLRRMERDLDLTPEQQARIDAILKDCQDHTRKTLHEEFQRTKTEFRQALTPAQQARFDELIKHSRPHEAKRPANGAERTPTAASATNVP